MLLQIAPLVRTMRPKRRWRHAFVQRSCKSVEFDLSDNEKCNADYLSNSKTWFRDDHPTRAISPRRSQNAKGPCMGDRCVRLFRAYRIIHWEPVVDRV